MNDVISAEYKNLFTTSTWNCYNIKKKIEFDIDFEDVVCNNKSQYFIST